MAKVTFKGMVNEADPSTILEYPNEQEGEPNYVLPLDVEVDVPDAVVKALQADETVKVESGSGTATETRPPQSGVTPPKDNSGSGS